MICSVFGVAYDRHLQHVEHRVTHLVAKDIEGLAEHGVVRCDAPGGRFLGHRLVNFVQVLIANDHIRSLIPSIRDSVASYRPECQIDWQSEWAEHFLQLLKRPVLLEEVVERLVRWVGRWYIFDQYAICSHVGRGCRHLWQRKAPDQGSNVKCWRERHGAILLGGANQC